MASAGTCALVLDTRCFDSSARETHAVAVAGAAESISQFLRLRLCSSEAITQRMILSTLNARTETLFSAPLTQATLSEATSALRDVRQYLLRSLDRGTDRSAELIAAAMAHLIPQRAEATIGMGAVSLNSTP